MNLAFFASGNGSNFQSVYKACVSGKLKSIPNVLISNNSDSGAIKFAKTHGLPHSHISKITEPDSKKRDYKILETLRHHSVDLILLLGYMQLLGTQTIEAYKDRILNIHPALLPKYGGKGMYGMNVHKAVIQSGDTETGVTLHLVNEEYDKGKILAQTKVLVEAGDTPESLAARVLVREHSFLVETLLKIENEEIKL
jgi:phosphoribosylglycinamide formyltransferase 1